MDDEILVNEAKSSQAAEVIADSVTRNLVKFGLAEARMRALRSVPHDEVRWQAGLPVAPFDMLYFGAVLRAMFEQREVVTSLLSGMSLAAAAGWEDPDAGDERA